MARPPLSTLESWRIRFLLAALLALLGVIALTVLTSLTTATSPLAGDPLLYEQSMQRLFSGQVPYIDFSFEHMPLSALPMSLAYLLSRTTSISYTLVFALVSLVMLFATGEVVVRIATHMEVGGAGRRWVWLVGPILPLVMFRIDALAALLASTAVLLAIVHRESPSLAASIGGILAKGWPVVGAASDWWRGKRARSIVLVVATSLIGVVLIATPGFRSGREFAGIHQETVLGALIATGRGLAGRDLGLVNAAGAVYVEVGQWAIGVTLAMGAVLALLSLLVLRRRFSWIGGIALTASLVFALILGSPLLSAQFLLWPMPFVAVTGSRSTRLALSIAGGMSTLIVGYWIPGSTWWHTFVVVRNGALIVTVGFAMRDLHVLSRSR